jgi:lipopolysaccharide export system protein LptC
MNAAKQFIGLFFILILLAFSGWYYSHSTHLLRLNDEALANTVNTTISNVTVRQFNQEGILANLLTTPLMQHIPKGDVYLFQNPHIIIQQEENQPPWDIRSKKAKSYEGGQRIAFMGQVVLHQKQGSTTQESTLKTEEITYFPREKKATTKLLVIYEQPGNIIQSTGMNAYLDEKRVELLHQARGSYVPKHG